MAEFDNDEVCILHDTQPMSSLQDLEFQDAVGYHSDPETDASHIVIRSSESRSRPHNIPALIFLVLALEQHSKKPDDVLGGSLNDLSLEDGPARASPVPSPSPPPVDPTAPEARGHSGSVGAESEDPSAERSGPIGRRLYVLSDAGKPIWSSTNEPEEVTRQTRPHLCLCDDTSVVTGDRSSHGPDHSRGWVRPEP